MRTERNYKLNWYKNLYVGNDAKKGIRRVIRRIDRGAYTPGYYLITLPAGERNQLEIISPNYLMQRPLRGAGTTVVGIAKGYGEALLLVEEIAGEVYRRTQTAKLRKYLEERIDRTGK